MSQEYQSPTIETVGMDAAASNTGLMAYTSISVALYVWTQFHLLTYVINWMKPGDPDDPGDG